MDAPLLEASNLSCSKGSKPIFSDLTFTVNEGDVVVLQGKSGSGKTTVLKALAHLNVYGGQVLYRGKPPISYGIPRYRTHVLYVPQRPSLLPGTPRDFLTSISTFQARQPTRSHPKPTMTSSLPEHPSSHEWQYPIEVARAWGIEEALWDRDWPLLSGGEAQRIALAVAVGLDAAEVLLLDEPTSALDHESSVQVEDFLANEMSSAESSLKAMVWVTHSEEQGKRVGTRFLSLSALQNHENHNHGPEP